MTDPLLELLERLPAGRLDASRADRIRVRCHAALTHQRRHTPSRPSTVRRWPLMVVGLGGLYLTEVARQVLTMYGIV
jgi:hypothetical protein